MKKFCEKSQNLLKIFIEMLVMFWSVCLKQSYLNSSSSFLSRALAEECNVADHALSCLQSTILLKWDKTVDIEKFGQYCYLMKTHFSQHFLIKIKMSLSTNKTFPYFVWKFSEPCVFRHIEHWQQWRRVAAGCLRKRRWMEDWEMPAKISI